MNQKEKDIYDKIDSLFNELNQAASSLNEFGKSVQKNAQSFSNEINESLKKNGYDNVKEFIDGEILDKKGQKPSITPLLKEIDSRYDFIFDTLSKVTYDIKYRGYFKEGHQEAIHHAIELMPDYRSDLDLFAQRIQEQIKELKNHRTNTKDAYTNGYIQGCKLIVKTIKESKKKMMLKVLRELDIRT